MLVSSDITINAPIADVFAAFSDLEALPDRIAGIDNVEVLAGNGFEVGTRWRETRTMFGKEATEEMEVTAVSAPVSYRVEAQSHGTHYVSEYEFTEVAAGTHVSMSFRGTPTGLKARLLAPIGLIFKGSVRKMLHQDLMDLKAAIEA